MFIEAGTVAGGGGGELEIFAHGHVGEERVILKHVAAAAEAWGQVDAGGGVEIEFVVDENAAFAGGGETAEAIEGECFARAAGAPKDGGGGVAFEMDVEFEGFVVTEGGEAFEETGINLDRCAHAW